MIKHKAEKAVKCLEEIQHLMSKTRSPYSGLTKQEAIEKMRKIRERLWGKKLVAHS